MLFRVICVCALGLLLAQAGSITNSDGMQVSWNITGTAVTFTIVVPSTLASNFDYWGIGFKSSGSSSDMVNSNEWIITKTGTFYDVYSTRNELPSLTTLGTARLTSHAGSGGSYTTVITRNLAAASSKEQGFSQGASYNLVYAYGSMTGTLLNDHSKSDSGGMTITLTNEFVSTSTSNTAAPVVVGLGTLAVLWLAFN